MKIFSARETELLRELDGLELAGFWQRAVAFLIDCFLMAVLLSVLMTLGLNGWEHLRQMHGNSGPAEYHLPVVKELPMIHGGMKLQLINIEGNEVIHVAATVIVPVLYCGVLLWAGKGRTPGKRLLKIRVVSLAHRNRKLFRDRQVILSRDGLPQLLREMFPSKQAKRRQHTKEKRREKTVDQECNGTLPEPSQF